MAAALKAASQMGYIEKSQTKAKSSGLQELVAKKFSIEDKSRYNFGSSTDFSKQERRIQNIDALSFCFVMQMPQNPQLFIVSKLDKCKKTNPCLVKLV